jgi:hypothetical protein
VGNRNAVAHVFFPNVGTRRQMAGGRQR